MHVLEKFCPYDEEGFTYDGIGIIANFIPDVTGVYRSATDPEKYYAEIHVELINTSIVDSFIIETSQISQLNISKKYAGFVSVDNSGKSTNALINKYLTLRIHEIFSRDDEDEIGFYFEEPGYYQIPGLGSVYVVGNSTIGKTSSSFIISRKVTRCSIPDDASVSDDEAILNLLSCINSAPKAKSFALAHTIVTFLRSAIKSCGIPLHYLLYLKAKQGYGKTTIAKNYCCLYDDSTNPNILPYVVDAGSSYSALKDEICTSKDCVVLLDDICLSTDSSEKRDRLNKAAKIIRIAANETPIKKKMGTKTVELFCNCGVVITGELPMKAASDVTRCIMVELDKPLTGDTQKERRTVQIAVLRFLNWFVANAPDRIEMLKKAYRCFKESSRDKKLERLQESLLILKWGFYEFLSFAQSQKVINDISFSALKGQFQKFAEEIFNAEAELVRKIEGDKPQGNLSYIINEGIRTKKLKISSKETVKPGCDGLYKDSLVCIEPKALLHFLQKAYNDTSLTRLEVGKLLRENSLIKPGRDGKSTKKIQGIRHYCIPINLLKKTAKHND